ncbi:hypothetical protein [Vibrio crassostreae]|uniref:hypothetical protein n=1 Tax=Vibrio crassostreae TaxID=246167 RepID=UPI001B3109D5|nr:hypothetical protein [Vibrio crassostreae]
MSTQQLPQAGTSVVAQVFTNKPRCVNIVAYRQTDDGKEGVVIDDNKYAIALHNFKFYLDISVDTPIIYEVERAVDDGNYEGVQHFSTVEYHFEPMIALERAEELEKIDREGGTYEVKVTRID